MNENWTKDDSNWAKEVLTCRQIVKEINSFGVNQNQKLKIIELLSLELEDHENGMAIAKIAKSTLERNEMGVQETPVRRILV